MFSLPNPTDRRRWDLSVAGSFAVHVLAILVLTHHSKPIFVMPSDVALGIPGSSGSIVYLAPVGAEKVVAEQERPKIALHPKVPKLTPPLGSPSLVRESQNASATSPFDQTAHAGSPYGSRVPGAPLTGHEVIPALPQVFPDPAVSSSDLPPGVQGDVVVEVTIDERGNVIELKLIRGIGYGIEARVLETLRQWRFRPASKDGVTISSQHIVTFHYPS